MTPLRGIQPRLSSVMRRTLSESSTTPTYLRSSQGMSSSSENPHTGVKIQERVGTSTLSPDATNESPFWTWRLCIQRVSNISISSDDTPNDSQISVERVWRSSVRTTRQPLPYLEIESESFW